MSVYGYARVSTADQNPQLQFDALTAAGIDAEHTFTDKASGASPDRPALADLMATVQAGDTLVVWKLDRLGRSTSHLVGLIDELGERGVDFRSLTDPIDTTTPSGRLLFRLIASMAEFERDLMLERTRAGLQAARASGKQVGRKPSIKPGVARHIDKLAEQGMNKTQIAEAVGVSRHAVTRYLHGQLTHYQASTTSGRTDN
ncbi:recombinase family protein [Brevibacterium sp. 5221]|uniref:Recombinase family protein n=1 Tax=Brevibacterium rongguiense TaxID=2695267 RepID=A0A6N9H919_9MICO|nr:recombinase family protein [Brevibacterium rongguiense]MYM20465.1 recombinase family protein [Brevibacterium rongguiense]